MAETGPPVLDEEPIQKSGLEKVEEGSPKAPVEIKLSSEAPPKKQRRAKLKAKDSSDKVIGLYAQFLIGHSFFNRLSLGILHERDYYPQ